MDIYPYGTLVSITVHACGKEPTKYYGYVRKVEVTETITYFIQFHPNAEYKSYTSADLHLEERD